MGAFYYVMSGALKGVNLKAGEKIPTSTQKLAKHLKIKADAGLLTGTSNSDYNLFVAYCILFIHMQQDAIAISVAWNGRKQLSGQSVADFATQVIDGADKLPNSHFASEEDKQGKIAEVFRTNLLPHFQDRIADCKSGHIAGITYTIEDYARIATGLESNLAKDLAAQQQQHLDQHARQAARVHAVAAPAPLTPQQQIDQLQQMVLQQQQQFAQQQQQLAQQQNQLQPNYQAGLIATNFPNNHLTAAVAAANPNTPNTTRQREAPVIVCTKCRSTQRLGTSNKWTGIVGHLAENCPTLSYPDGVICKYCKANHHTDVCPAPQAVRYRARQLANAGAAAPPLPPAANYQHAPNLIPGLPNNPQPIVAGTPAHHYAPSPQYVSPAPIPAGAPSPNAAPAAAKAAAANTRPPPPGAPKSG